LFFLFSAALLRYLFAGCGGHFQSSREAKCHWSDDEAIKVNMATTTKEKKKAPIG
jgi:hypothetical protein